MSDNIPNNDLPDFYEIVNDHGYMVGHCSECHKPLYKAHVVSKLFYCIQCFPHALNVFKAKKEFESLNQKKYVINCLNCGHQWKGDSTLVMCPQCEKTNQFSVVSDKMGSICVIKNCGKIAHKGIRWMCDTHFDTMCKPKEITISEEDFRLRWHQFPLEKLINYLKEKGVKIV